METELNKLCRVCGQTKPLDAFHRNRWRKPDGRHGQCRWCRSAIRKWGRRREKRRADTTLMRRVVSLLAQGRGLQRLPVGQLYDCVLDEFGGTAGIAQRLCEFMQAPATSNAHRLRAHIGVIRLIIAAEEYRTSKKTASRWDSDEDYSVSTPEAIQRRLKQILHEMYGNVAAQIIAANGGSV